MTRRERPVKTDDAHFHFTPTNLAWAQRRIAEQPKNGAPGAIITLLRRAQDQAGGWLPESAVRTVADLLDMPYARAAEVASFHTMFNARPVGTHFVQICRTTPCWLRGSDDMEAVCRDVLGDPDVVTDDGSASWTRVECLGACVNAPVVQIGDDYYEDLTADAFRDVLRRLRRGEPVSSGPRSGRRASEPRNATGPTDG